MRLYLSVCLLCKSEDHIVFDFEETNVLVETLETDKEEQRREESVDVNSVSEDVVLMSYMSEMMKNSKSVKHFLR